MIVDEVVYTARTALPSLQWRSLDGGTMWSTPMWIYPPSDDEIRRADVANRLKLIADLEAETRRQTNQRLAAALGGTPVE